MKSVTRTSANRLLAMKSVTRTSANRLLAMKGVTVPLLIDY